MADDNNNDMIEQPPAPGTAQAEPIVPETPDEAAALRQELDAAKAREAEYLDGWQRARAELSNARKRFQRDLEQAHDQAAGEVLLRLLPIVDDFERALAAVPANEAAQGWMAGVAMIHRKLQLLLEAQGVTQMEPAGQPFDPMAHQAVTHEPSGAVPEGHVIEQVQKGYHHRERVLRPASVRVSSGLPETEAPSD